MPPKCEVTQRLGFSPSIFCHLIGIIPCAWILEFDLLEVRRNGNSTSDKLNSDVLIVSAERWTDLIQQTTMLMMILGRWLLPTAQGMTKDSLSQLLLVNLAMCADIIEFFDILKLSFVKSSHTLIVTILCLWTWSLMQFPFNTMLKLDIEDEGSDEKKTAKNVDKNLRGKRAIVPYEGELDMPNRASMTSIDFRQAIAAKRMSRDILLMSHNYSRGLPAGYLPDFRRNSYQPHVRDSDSPEPNLDHIQNVHTERGISNGQPRGPGRFSLDVGQMRAKGTTRYMTTSMTSPNLRLDLKGLQEDMIRSKEKSARTNSAGLETNVDIDADFSEEEETKKSRITIELLGILMSLFMQDGPFLTFRLFIIAQYQAYEYMVIFLTAKNALVLALQVYRLCVLHCTCYDHKENDFSPENEIDANSRLKNVQVAISHGGNEESEDESLHTMGWNFTRKWRRSFKNPFSSSHLSDSQVHLAP
ncbi:Transmembrane protein 26 [Stylophora pistillata]|uniref:Transmembrane protein 26 n=1 Tax=Stylophora pistillata TaxID=50429 RepID=A0A2B4SQS6_STYPI|nr:Transmembrane protein 26 [Stylophora pistillata]